MNDDALGPLLLLQVAHLSGERRTNWLPITEIVIQLCNVVPLTLHSCERLVDRVHMVNEVPEVDFVERLVP